MASTDSDHSEFNLALISCPACPQIQWELGSPLFGFLLRKYAPHDTYEARRGRP